MSDGEDTKSKRLQRRPSPLPTLGDVARHAAVSTATVSRYFSNPEKVKPAMRMRVQAAVSALGYTPHGAARALASHRSNTIGAVIPTLDNAIFATVVQTLQKELAQRGKTLLLAASNYDLEHERDQIENLVVRGIDGLMLTGEGRDPALYELLDRRAIRYVSTYVHHPNSPHPTIGFDNRRAMHRVIEYLLHLGHKSFAMIAGITQGNDRASARILGVRDALKRAGLRLEPARVIECPYSVAAGRDALRQLTALPPPPTAVVCGNDVLAFGAVLEAAALGIAVPKDLSITGFDDLDLAREIPPGLTTIHAPLEEMGRRTAAYLLGGGPVDDGPPHIELPADLVVRGSTGPRRS